MEQINIYIGENTRIDSTSTVTDYAQILDESRVRDRAIVRGHAILRDHSSVRKNAVVEGFVEMKRYAKIFGNVHVSGQVKMGGESVIRDNAVVNGNIRMMEYAYIGHNAKVRTDKDTHITIRGHVSILGNAIITATKGNHISISGNVTIPGDALIKSEEDFLYLYFNGRDITCYRRQNGGIGCHYYMGVSYIFDSLEEFREHVLFETTCDLTSHWFKSKESIKKHHESFNALIQMLEIYFR